MFVVESFLWNEGVYQDKLTSIYMFNGLETFLIDEPNQISCIKMLNLCCLAFWSSAFLFMIFWFGASFG